MLGVNTNTAAAHTYNALRINTKSMEDSMLRLSTGKRLNSAADDPGSVVISSELEKVWRAEKQGIQNAIDGISMLQTISTAGQNIQTLLHRMRELAVMASTNTYTADDHQALDLEYNLLGNEWARIAEHTRFNKMALMGTEQPAFKINLGGSDEVEIRIKNWSPGHFHAADGSAVTGATSTSTANNGGEAFNFTRVGGVSNSHIQSVADAGTALGDIDKALEGASQELAKYGAYINRLRFYIDGATDISTTLENSQSKIVDTDYSIESTNLAKTQIVSQAATAILAQANQAPQVVLALLK
ncbi:MAG: flagellin [Rhodospirillaceae bacterium]